MILNPEQFLEQIYSQFSDYYNQFLKIAERADGLFTQGKLDDRLEDDLLRVKLYRLSIRKSIAYARSALENSLYDNGVWVNLRQRFKDRYTDPLATTYFTSVMRKVFAERQIPIEFSDDGICMDLVDAEAIVSHYSVTDRSQIGQTFQKALYDSAFSGSFSVIKDQDMGIILDIINENLDKNSGIQSFELLKPPFFRGKGAYLVGQFQTQSAGVPVIICCVHTTEGIKLDAVLIGYEATRSFLFSSTRSTFTVSTRYYRQLYSFLQRLYPNENPAYILDIIGFTHPAKLILLQELRKKLQTGNVCRYLGIGPIDFVFGIQGFPLVFKVIRRNVPDREKIIHNFIKIHTIDRLGQVLDSLDYKNLGFKKDQFSPRLIEKLEQEQSEDVRITTDHIFFNRVYAARRITSVRDLVRTAGKAECRQLLLKVGWNIKHLAAMGFLPRSVRLEHFGLTTWDRVVYLGNPSLLDIRRFQFEKSPDYAHDLKSNIVNPSDFEKELDIPQPHKEVFRAIHGDLFTVHFWDEIKAQVINGRYPDFFPYPSRYRLDSRKFRKSVFDELKRISSEADTHQIHMALDKLAVMDVELAGLSFLRLEVPQPSARVLVVEPIGPEIIAQLHRRFQDVTFDILQSESEVVENAGNWTPGIHGKLNTLVQVRRYDYVIGYVNETFDEDFFRLARLKGFLLLSTGIHNIDVKAATDCHTVVTNAPGPTTTTVAEQNVGLILDALYSGAVRCGGRYGQIPEGFIDLASVDTTPTASLAVAQTMWLCFLQQTLKLETMFSFGASELYVRTGVGEQATVYHDQIGQNIEAGINRSLGVIGLNNVGIHIIEISIVHEVSTIYVLSDEYENLDRIKRERLEQLINIKESIAPLGNESIRLSAVSRKTLFSRSDYIFHMNTHHTRLGSQKNRGKKVHVDIRNIFSLGLPDLYESSICHLTLGIQGLGRIGEAVAQRAIQLGMNIIIHQRDPERPKYQKKLENLKKLAAHYRKWSGRPLKVVYARSKDEFFTKSNVISTLAATTEHTRGWVDKAGLDQFGQESLSPVRVLVSAGKGLVNEEAMIQFLKNNPDAQARLDVLIAEHEGGAYLKLIHHGDQPLENLKVTGHTAAAVREVRQLKIFKALDNLRKLIDGRIPPNIVNNIITKGKESGTQEVVEIEGLKFFRMSVPSPKARVLVIEPLPAELILNLQQAFGDVSFDILLAESELVKEGDAWAPGINNRLNTIVSRQYDYCLGYCNANFDAAFFNQAQLKGLILFATATHHIDLATATQTGTTVTNSPGFTTIAVTEQNIGMALDGIYGKSVLDTYTEGAVSLDEFDLPDDSYRSGTIAQILWFILLKKALRLDAMYEFGTGDKYVRTGVRRDATVYHDQLGQYDEAGIKSSIAVIGLDEVGIYLIELAVQFEMSVVFVLEEEYQGLSYEKKSRLNRLVELMTEISQTKPFNVKIKPVDKETLAQEATYTIKTPSACRDKSFRDIRTQSAIRIQADNVFVNDPAVFDRSLIGLTFGVQGLGRIGEAVVQRAISLGADIVVCQRNPERPKYQEKLKRLKQLVVNRARIYRKNLDIKYVDKVEFFSSSNIVTTLAATTTQTRFWVDRDALDMLGRETDGPVKVLVNAGKGLLSEADLGPFLYERPDVEVRLDVLSDEQKGSAGKRFMDEQGRQPANFKIAGHTAAAVPEIRRLKMLNALKNLRLHIDGKRPGNMLNPELIFKS